MRSNPLSRFRFLPFAVMVMTFAPPAALAAPAHPVTSAASQPGLGMSQAEARAALAKLGYTFEKTDSGLKATAPAGAFVVSLVGPPGELTKIGGLMGMTSDPALRAATVAQVTVFLWIMFPDWPEATAWVADHGMAAMAGPQTIRRGDRELLMQGDALSGVLLLAIWPAETAAAEAAAAAAERDAPALARAAALTEAAKARRSEGLDDIEWGDAAAERGDYDAAMRAWTRAYKNPETSLAGAERLREGWLRKAAALADAGDWAGAAEAVREAPHDAVAGELRGRIAVGLLPSDPSAAAELLAESPDTRVQFAAVYRKALIAKAGDSCSDDARAAFRAANGIAPLRGISAQSAAACEAEEGSALVDREAYSGAIDAYYAGQAYSGASAEVAALGRELASASRNRGLIPGVVLLAGGGAAAVVAVLRQGAAQATADDLRAAAHPGAEVDALIAEGASAQLEATLLSVGALALGGTGVGVIVIGGARVPEELRGLRLSLAPSPTGGLAVLSGAF